VHYTMGGLWVDLDHMTNIKGLFCAGEAEYQYHGANRLGANALLSCTHAGMIAGPAAINYISGLEGDAPPSSIFDDELKKQKDINHNLMTSDGSENPYRLHQELGELMTENVTVIRVNEKLAKTDEDLQVLQERYKDVGLPDKTNFANNDLIFARELKNMLHLARVITQGAWRRNESRGSHYKPEFPNRDDENWLKTTKAKHTSNGPEFSYEDVDIQHIKPRMRKYD
jgi:succinate dehydrogenase / fumarate reductase, flavoprotein subunit